MRYANITEAFVILGVNKWDIPAYLGDSRLLDMHLAYLTVHVPFGVPFSLDQAYPFVRNAVVALGFPDILLTLNHVYETLLQHLYRTGADVILGLFAEERHYLDIGTPENLIRASLGIAPDKFDHSLPL